MSVNSDITSITSITYCYNVNVLRAEAVRLLSGVEKCFDLNAARRRLLQQINSIRERAFNGRVSPPAHELIRVRDCAQALTSVLNERSDARTGFSIAQALWDIARQRPRDDLKPGFYAEIIYWIKGLEGRALFQYLGVPTLNQKLTGRMAALARSAELDRLWQEAETRMSRFANGLSTEAQERRLTREQQILEVLGSNTDDWDDWRWQVRHRIENVETLERLVSLSESEQTAIKRACEAGLPFAITPYYVSLMDCDTNERDQAIRAQVIPPSEYVDYMVQNQNMSEHSFDFMREGNTSPINRVTRRYPGIVILKPYNACPQICVYCQRNWEIHQAMAPSALASDAELEAAIRWIEKHPAIHEVLVTGGEPMVLSDEYLERLLTRIARISTIDLIRIGTRTPVTLPMRITEDLASILGSFRQIGRRDVAVVTHIEHPYEVTLDTARAVDRLRRAGISIYNQQVYTFYVSRRFESAMLRMLLRRIGVDPYYTFTPKGKEETKTYRVPIARILQEQKEEARLMTGLRRTDEAVYNVPGLGKNYLRAIQHRDLLTVLPNGSRVYEFHPWERNIALCETYLVTDVPILDYLARLEEIGEDTKEYASIWYYF